jgi:hypothetical protein
MDGSKAEATVRLARNGDLCKGAASGLNSSANQLRSIATATLRAVENSGAVDGTMVIEDMNTGLVIGGKTVVVVLINVVTDRGEEYLTGSSIVRQDLWKAAVNATLDAVNRRTTLITDD